MKSPQSKSTWTWNAKRVWHCTELGHLPEDLGCGVPQGKVGCSRGLWTVKVDPDAVFFPDRLRTVLAHYVEPPNGGRAALNNCKFGMHGPIEVFSRNAIGAFQAARDQCTAHFEQMCQGDCKWGEDDIWVDQCLKYLNVQREDEWQLLVEETIAMHRCHGPPPHHATAATCRSTLSRMTSTAMPCACRTPRSQRR
ncbi:unnamed protein product [Prorocentrum cordatum]|uniref:Uncharacterized protein n=1 Tax=Prorocentrum cordatum TaxID=2364126 RepID=A0ABN9PL74_9DINO|nr:unnamed protein product [Polarella glacialis]